MKRNLLLFMTLAAIQGCQDADPVIWSERQGYVGIQLSEFTVLEGQHCESSAMINALAFQGYDFQEYHIPGGAGTMGFLFENNGFPFLGGRSLDMKESFLNTAGIGWEEGDNSDKETAWKGVIEQLEKNIPVVLRVDMRYLPYLYGGNYGSEYTSFGWHIITIYGIDFDTSTAYVSDTAQKGFQEIRLSDLDKARSSELDFLPPEYEYYWIEKKPASYKPDWDVLFKNSVTNIIKNAEYTFPEDSPSLGGLAGMKKWAQWMSDYDTQVPNQYIRAAAMSSFYGWIEEYGTGGASFRQFTLEFFRNMYEKLQDPEILEAAELLQFTVDQWHKLALLFKNTGQALEKGMEEDQRKHSYTEISGEIERLYELESNFVSFLKENW